MEKYCKKCGRVFDDLTFKICPYCGSELSTRYGRQPIPRKLRHEVFKRDGYRCRECGASKDETSLEIDHILPVAKGGTNDIDNLQTLCRECNRMKHTDEWIGGENSIETAKNELNNLINQLQNAEVKLKQCSTEDEILEYKFKIKKLTTKLIPNAQNKLNNLQYEAKIVKINNQIRQKEKKRKEKLFKELFVKLNSNKILAIGNYLSLSLKDDEEILKFLVKNYSSEEINLIINLADFENLNTTTDSIHNLEGNNVLIILEDGTNLTSWDEVNWQYDWDSTSLFKYNTDIVYVSEDLTNQEATGKYKGLKSLKTIIISGVTSKIKDMEEMFFGCESLVNICGLEDWDVSGVESMWSIFEGCESLEDISALSGWDVSNVEVMASMFDKCKSLKDISALSGWDVSNVEIFANMFYGCESLEDISALSGWDVSNSINLWSMFGGCVSLEDISALSGWNVSKVEMMFFMFSGCESLKDVSNLNKWKVAKSCDIRNMFEKCNNLNEYPKWY